MYLTNAYFVPDTQLLQALCDAAGRGVDVRLILPSYSDWLCFTPDAPTTLICYGPGCRFLSDMARGRTPKWW